jgi:hypothetical protein
VIFGVFSPYFEELTCDFCIGGSPWPASRSTGQLSLSFKQCKTPMQIEFTVYLGHRIPRKIGPARSYTTRPERAFKRAPTGPRRGVEKRQRHEKLERNVFDRENEARANDQSISSGVNNCRRLRRGGNTGSLGAVTRGHAERTEDFSTNRQGSSFSVGFSDRENWRD